MGVGCIQSEGLVVSFQDESVTKSGREPDQQEQGAGTEPKPNGRRGEATRQRTCLGRVLRKTAWAAGYQARGPSMARLRRSFWEDSGKAENIF